MTNPLTTLIFILQWCQTLFLHRRGTYVVICNYLNTVDINKFFVRGKVVCDSWKIHVRSQNWCETYRYQCLGSSTLAHSAKMIMVLHYTYVHHSGNQLFAISKVEKKARVSARNTFSLHQYTIAPSLFMNRWSFYISFYVERSYFDKQPELV